MAAIGEWFGKQVSVIANDGRHILGRLKGNDQLCNIILEEAHERVYSLDAPVQMVPLGLYLIRGDDIAIVGLLDEEVDSRQNFEELRAAPIGDVVT